MNLPALIASVVAMTTLAMGLSFDAQKLQYVD
jgi:hypothetical protein